MFLAPPFRLTWLLVRELAIGTAPRQPEHLEHLHQDGLAAVLSLCAVQEAPPPVGLDRRFRLARVVLPDHRCSQELRPEAIQQALSTLAALRAHGPVFVHCVAAAERSPVLAIAWLMHTRGLTLESALAYVQSMHPGTSPLPRQLAAVQDWQRRFGSDPRLSACLAAA